MSTVDPNSVDEEAPVDPGLKQRSYTEKDFEGEQRNLIAFYYRLKYSKFFNNLRLNLENFNRLWCRFADALSLP